MLNYYKSTFDTVELNNTFYQIPKEDSLRLWSNTVDKSFIFSVKANRYITHMKKLKDPDKSVNTFMDKIKGIKSKMGIILFQLPPKWKCNIERLKSFLNFLPKEYRYTFEFRDPDWFNDKVYSLLNEYNSAFCIYDIEGKLSPKEVTADFIYIRLHGPNEKYKGLYSKKALEEWKDNFLKWTEKGKEIYCYFDNDEKAYAPQNAIQLKEMFKGGA